LILDCLDLLSHVRIVEQHLFLTGLELFGKAGNAAGQLFLVRPELLAEIRIVAPH